MAGGLTGTVLHVSLMKLLGVLFPSSTFPDRAYPDEIMLTAFFGGACHPDLASKDTDTLKTIVRQEQINDVLLLNPYRRFETVHGRF